MTSSDKAGRIPAWLREVQDGDGDTRPANDLESVALKHCSELRKLRSRLRSLDPDMVSMTGSGSAFYALFATLQEARKKAKLLEWKEGDVFTGTFITRRRFIRSFWF